LHLEWIRDTCLGFPNVTEDFPFDNTVLVFRIGGKIFALISIIEPNSINLKADPERSGQWRAEFHQVQPGFHMNKKHWNTVYFEGLPEVLIKEMMEHSYQMVFEQLPLKMRKIIRAIP
jgi:predicted DNA-binding protein (MmcQ/YjbR family)